MWCLKKLPTDKVHIGKLVWVKKGNLRQKYAVRTYRNADKKYQTVFGVSTSHSSIRLLSVSAIINNGRIILDKKMFVKVFFNICKKNLLFYKFCSIIPIVEKKQANVAELADALDSGSSGNTCRFKSCHSHHERVVILIQFVLELQPFFLFFRAFLAYKRLLTGILPVKSRFGYDKYFRR